MSEHNEYPVAHHPSDNASLRPSYKKPLKMEVAFVKDDRGVSTTAIWLLVRSEENSVRYNAIADLDPQATRIDILRQAGATFYPHWHQSEVVRYMRKPTMTTNIAFGKISTTEENLRLAEQQLDQNTLRLEEGQIVEERKTLQWLKDDLFRT
ncbi:hypothetical protein OIDMADRAFT_30781 [Oidiodendron maius Zn]|uniref:Uncharacterized protein n=1 Tax=Oidiodendron maius (strain Zn) TaxID=913774 RepID=A0A0C3CJP9_OIDMZ|nr:hypothetical protein OIDMADRAFT_30781 [Oidiodendron maius Zn]